MPSLQARLIDFLQYELLVPSASISTALRHPDGQLPHLLPMVLWQYGLVSLEQLDHIFSWLEAAHYLDIDRYLL